MEPKALAPRRLLVNVALLIRLSLLLAPQQPEAAAGVVLQAVVVAVEQRASQCLKCLEFRMEQ